MHLLTITDLVTKPKSQIITNLIRLDWSDLNFLKNNLMLSLKTMKLIGFFELEDLSFILSLMITEISLTIRPAMAFKQNYKKVDSVGI